VFPLGWTLVWSSIFSGLFLSFQTLPQLGIGGQYLTHPKTFKLCRTEFFMPSLMSRKNPDAWIKEGKKRIDKIAKRLAFI
jgi:trimethylamine--corrinoid protein Co-methyltransferase